MDATTPMIKHATRQYLTSYLDTISAAPVVPGQSLFPRWRANGFHFGGVRPTEPQLPGAPYASVTACEIRRSRGGVLPLPGERHYLADVAAAAVLTRQAALGASSPWRQLR